MAQFRDAVITQAGIALLQKTQMQSIKLTFTKIAVGSGEYEEEESLDNVTALKNKIQEFPISSKEIVDFQTILLKSVISNNELDEAYYIREIGVYANDPDNGEILYSLAVAYPGKADYFPAYDGMAPVTIGIDTYQTVSDSGNVIIQAGSGAYAAAEDLEKLEQRVSSKTVNIVVMDEDIPIINREARTFYLKVTDRQSIGFSESIKVSPNMGIKIV